MADSSRTIMTDAGFALETRVRADETKMQFTRATISTDDHFSDTDDALAKLTELSNIQQDGKVTAVQVINTTTVYVQVDVNQAESKADYQMRSAALYAKDDDGTEVLYGVTVLQDPVFVHKDADGSYLGFGINTTVGRASNVVVVVDPANMVTQQVFESTMKNYYTKAEVDAKFVTDDDFASKLPKNIATTDAANTFAKSQTFAGGATDGAGNAIATTKDVSDGDTETLKSAKDYADTKISGKADDSKVVHTADMRKPASDVAGIDEVNAVDAKGLARNLIANSGYMVNLDGWQGVQGGILALSTHSFYHNGTGNVIKLINPKTSEVFAISDWFKVKPNTQYTFQFILFGTANTTSTDVFLIGKGTNVTNIIIGYVQSPIKPELITKTFTTGNFEDAYIRVDNNGSKDGNNCYIAFTEVQLEEGTVAHPWTPSFQDKLTITPADDSKVAHLSGANNFDTVPTVNNNPLLLASSLPSDLARTGSNQEFTGKNTFDTAPIDKKTGNPYITKDGVPAVPSTLADTTKDANFTGKLQKSGIDVATKSDVTTAVSAVNANMVHRNPNTGVVSEPVDFTKLTVEGGKSVATSDDLKSLEASAWRPIISNNYSGLCMMKYNADTETMSLSGTIFPKTYSTERSRVAVIIPMPEGFSMGVNTNSKTTIWRNTNGGSEFSAIVVDLNFENDGIHIIFDKIYTSMELLIILDDFFNPSTSNPHSFINFKVTKN